MYLKDTDESLRHIGPGTAMGDLLRRYWVPVVLERDVIGTASIAVRVFGEDLVATLAASVFTSATQRATYPIVQRGGIAWTYMGPNDEPPPLPDFEWLLTQEAGHDATKRTVSVGWSDAVGETLDAAGHHAHFVPPFYLLQAQHAEAFVPIDDGTACVWSFKTHAADEVPGDPNEAPDFRHLMIQLARDNARGHTPT